MPETLFLRFSAPSDGVAIIQIKVVVGDGDDSIVMGKEAFSSGSPWMVEGIDEKCKRVWRGIHAWVGFLQACQGIGQSGGVEK
jgi:hypothetical protein